MLRVVCMCGSASFLDVGVYLSGCLVDVGYHTRLLLCVRFGSDPPMERQASPVSGVLSLENFRQTFLKLMQVGQ